MGLKSEAYENDLEGNYEPKQDLSIHRAEAEKNTH